MYVREWVRGYVSMLYVGIEYVFMFSCTSVRMWVCGCAGACTMVLCQMPKPEPKILNPKPGACTLVLC